jgi:hypothetical protein
MDMIRQLEIYDDKQLYDINAVQMYLQVMTLSDIADANGHQISEEAFKGQKLSNRYSRLKWRRQPVIMTKEFFVWKAALEGEWTGPPTQVWRNFYNLGTNQVITSMTGSMIQFTEYKVSQ